MYSVRSGLNFGEGEPSTSEGNLCFSSSDKILNEYDELIFVDSRGFENESSIESTWLYRLMEMKDASEIRYLVVSRPKNLTIIPTLIQFVGSNDIKFRKLITNAGFVDCTPKKLEFISDIRRQIASFSGAESELIEYPKFELSSGESVNLYSLKYSDQLISEMKSFIHGRFSSTIFVNTPVVSEKATFERKRPGSFFWQLKASNLLISDLAEHVGGVIVDISHEENMTFDGVHFNSYGHDILLKLVTRLVRRNLSSIDHKVL